MAIESSESVNGAIFFEIAKIENSGKINEAWDRDFLERWTANRRERLIAYSDAETYREGGQGGFEIRALIAVAGAAEGSTGEIWCYTPIPIFAVGCTVGVMNLAPM